MSSGPNDHLLLVFRIDDRRYSLRLGAVLRVLPMMDVTPLPSAPAVVSGIVNVAGQIVPVMDLRRRLGLAPRESQLSDVLVIARARTLTVALPADGVVGVIDPAYRNVVPACAVAPGTEHIAGVVKLDDELALIHDLDTFLSLHEEAQLVDATRDREARS